MKTRGRRRSMWNSNPSKILGQEMSGNWVIHVSDNAGADLGTLNEWCVKAIYAGGATGVDAIIAPASLALSQNYPNPFRSRTTFRFALPRDMVVDLTVYNVAGQRVKTLASGVMPLGHHAIDWSGRDHRGARVSSGIYFYRLTTEDKTLTRKLLHLK